MKKIILLIMSASLLQGCDDINEMDEGKYANFSSASKERQMVEALNSLPSDQNISGYRHFHISAGQEDERRMILYLYETLANPEHQAVSIGCEKMDSCKHIVLRSVEMLSERTTDRTDLLVMIPSFISFSEQEAASMEISITEYEVYDPFDI